MSLAMQHYCFVGVFADYVTCVYFPMAMGSHSSGEVFVDMHANWSPYVSGESIENEKEKLATLLEKLKL